MEENKGIISVTLIQSKDCVITTGEDGVEQIRIKRKYGNRKRNVIKHTFSTNCEN